MTNFKFMICILLVVLLVFSACDLFGSNQEDKSKVFNGVCPELDCVAKDSNCYYSMGIDENNCTVCGDLICSVIY